jgi:hypothetical protein
VASGTGGPAGLWGGAGGGLGLSALVLRFFLAGPGPLPFCAPLPPEQECTSTPAITRAVTLHRMDQAPLRFPSSQLACITAPESDGRTHVTERGGATGTSNPSQMEEAHRQPAITQEHLSVTRDVSDYAHC